MLSILVLGAACAVIAAEISLKVIANTPLWRVLPVVEPILGRPDYDTGYSLAPLAAGIWVKENRAPIAITNLGLRGPDGIAAQKPVGTIRIGVTGDSMVEALQVEYDVAFTALLQERLNGNEFVTSNTPKIEVLNLAQAGNGPLRQLLRLETVGFGLNLDIVLSIVAATDFVSGELLDDSLNPAYVASRSGELERGYAYRQRFSIRHLSSPAGELFLTAIQHSEVARLIYLRSRERPGKLLGLETAGRPAVENMSATDPCDDAVLRTLRRLWLEHQPELHWRATEKFFQEYSGGIRRFRLKAIYAMRDIPLPPPHCAAAHALRREVAAEIGLKLERYGVSFVDLEPFLAREMGVGSSAAMAPMRGFGVARGLGHLNHKGHEIYAGALLEVLAPVIGVTAW